MEKAQVPINYLTWTYDLAIVFQCFKYVSYDDDSEFTFFTGVNPTVRIHALAYGFLICICKLDNRTQVRTCVRL